MKKLLLSAFLILTTFAFAFSQIQWKENTLSIENEHYTW
jgi:hypothetical protein